MINILEHEIKDKIIDLKILKSGFDITKEEINNATRKKFNV